MPLLRSKRIPELPAGTTLRSRKEELASAPRVGLGTRRNRTGHVVHVHGGWKLSAARLIVGRVLLGLPHSTTSTTLRPALDHRKIGWPQRQRNNPASRDGCPRFAPLWWRTRTGRCSRSRLKRTVSSTSRNISIMCLRTRNNRSACSLTTIILLTYYASSNAITDLLKTPGRRKGAPKKTRAAQAAAARAQDAIKFSFEVDTYLLILAATLLTGA